MHLEIFAAGSHNAILIGHRRRENDVGQATPTILLLTLAEALEATKIHSVAGKLPEHTALVNKGHFKVPPYHLRCGTGGRWRKPTARRNFARASWVLFLDELPEFKGAVLEVMRQPMEERKVTISRARIALDFPGQFHVGGSSRPPALRLFNHPEKECGCAPGVVENTSIRYPAPCSTGSTFTWK